MKSVQTISRNSAPFDKLRKLASFQKFLYNKIGTTGKILKKARKEEEMVKKGMTGKQAAVVQKGISIPRNQTEAVQVIHQIREEQEAIKIIEDKLRRKLRELGAEAAVEIARHEKRIEELIRAHYAFASANQKELTKGGRQRTIKWLIGIFGWRRKKRTVILTKPVETIVKELEERGLNQLIHVKKTVDKNAVAKEPNIAKTVPGIRIVQEEEFFIVPEGGKRVSLVVETTEL